VALIEGLEKDVEIDQLDLEDAALLLKMHHPPSPPGGSWRSPKIPV
jgi:hypothetical protein